jgi:hypothetical protein
MVVKSSPAKQRQSNVAEIIGLFLGPARRLQLMVVGGIGLAIMSWLLLSDLRNYRSAGSQPSDMTIAAIGQAGTTKPFSQRWVRLVEPVNLECSHALQSVEGSNVTEVVLAYDSSKEQPLWLEYKGSYACETLKDIPLEGMLVEPDKFWSKHGMFAPPSRYPLMELKVGRSPADLLKDAESMGAACLLFLVMLSLAYITRPKKKAVSLMSPLAKIGP